jgi:hypothetical protein
LHDYLLKIAVKVAITSEFRVRSHFHKPGQRS